MKSTKGEDSGSLVHKTNESYHTPPTTYNEMLSVEIYQFSPLSTYTTLQPIIQLEEGLQVVWNCCCTRVVEITDNEGLDRSSSSESYLDDNNNLPELEDQENHFPILMI